jgi:hypothetical protein
MPDLSPQEKYYRTKRYVVIGGVIVVIILALLLWNGCQKAKNDQLAYEAVKERLDAAIKDTARVNSELAKERKNSRELEFSVADLQSRYVISTRALQDEARVSERLRLKIRNAKVNNDTASYVDNCDSLVEASEQSERHRLAALRQAAMIDSIRIEQIKGKNREIKILQGGYDSCMSAIIFTNNTLPQLKPTSKVYFDITGMVGAVPAIGAGLGFMTKDGKMISVDVLYSAHGSIYQLRASSPLSFKKRK